MTTTGGLPTGLTYLPNWLADAKDATELERLLMGWVRASGWKTAGLGWITEGKAELLLSARADGLDANPAIPSEWNDVYQTLLNGQPTVLWQLPNSSGRLYALVAPCGRTPGVFWAERSPTAGAWTDTERSFVKLTAQMIERSPALGQKLGPIIDPARLHQRLTDASVIAGRMAHDFDNILTGIMGFADLTLPMLTAASQPAKFVGEISKVGQRGITLTQQLHSMSRSGASKPFPGSVQAVVSQELARLKPHMPMGLIVNDETSAALPSVAMDGIPLKTVVAHLLENAIQASPATGRITISAKTVEFSPSDAREYLGQVTPGSHVELVIRDTGSGIKPDVRSRLFVEPFFTTKVRHRGLGLAIVYRVLFAHRSGIRIDAATPPDVGTTVRVVIPIATARPTVVPAASPLSATIGG